MITKLIHVHVPAKLILVMVSPHIFVPVVPIFGLCVILSSTNWPCEAAGPENGKAFKESMKDFASIADNLAGGLKTVAKAVKIISGDIGEEAEECTFVCKNGAIPRKKIGYIPEDNGCGAYGFKVDLSKLPAMEKCCSKHDRCYGQCGMEKEACDLTFSLCLENVCTQLLHTMGLNDEESEGCMMTVQLMYLTVLELGCDAYLDAQKQACVCKLHPDDNKTSHDKTNKHKVEL